MILYDMLGKEIHVGDTVLRAHRDKGFYPELRTAAVLNILEDGRLVILTDGCISSGITEPDRVAVIK